MVHFRVFIKIGVMQTSWYNKINAFLNGYGTNEVMPFELASTIRNKKYGFLEFLGYMKEKFIKNNVSATIGI